MDTKVCTKCHETRNITEYGKNKRYKLGIENICKICMKIRVVENKEKFKASHLRWKAKNQTYYKNYEKTSKRQRYTKEYYVKNKERYTNNKHKSRSLIKKKKELPKVEENFNITSDIFDKNEEEFSIA